MRSTRDAGREYREPFFWWLANPTGLHCHFAELALIQLEQLRVMRSISRSYQDKSVHLFKFRHIGQFGLQTLDRTPWNWFFDTFYSDLTVSAQIKISGNVHVIRPVPLYKVYAPFCYAVFINWSKSRWDPRRDLWFAAKWHTPRAVNTIFSSVHFSFHYLFGEEAFITHTSTRTRAQIRNLYLSFSHALSTTVN